MTNDDAGQLAVYRSIFEKNPAFIFRCGIDDHRTMQLMDGQVRHISGFDAVDIVENKEVSFASLVHEEDRQMVQQCIAEGIESDEPWNIIYRMMRKDGAVAWVRERGCAIRNEVNDVTHQEGLIVEAYKERALQEKISEMAVTAKKDSDAMTGLAKSVLSSQQLLSILAINGRIEAARVGDTGRGFAIIADEINQVVQTNAALAEEISARIEMPH